jgi:hypothetical protein
MRSIFRLCLGVAMLAPLNLSADTILNSFAYAALHDCTGPSNSTCTQYAIGPGFVTGNYQVSPDHNPFSSISDSGRAIVNSDGTLGAAVSSRVIGQSNIADAQAILIDQLVVNSSKTGAGTIQFKVSFGGSARPIGVPSNCFTFGMTGDSSYDQGGGLCTTNIAQTTVDAHFGLVLGDTTHPFSTTNGALDLITPDSTKTFTLPITFGAVFTYSQGLGVEVRNSTSGLPFSGVTAGGEIDFYDPAQISGVAVFDSTGNPVTDWTIDSGSRLTYTVNGIGPAVPEPSTFGVLAVGLFGLFVAMKQKRFRLGLTLRSTSLLTLLVSITAAEPLNHVQVIGQKLDGTADTQVQELPNPSDVTVTGSGVVYSSDGVYEEIWNGTATISGLSLKTKAAFGTVCLTANCNSLIPTPPGSSHPIGPGVLSQAFMNFPVYVWGDGVASIRMDLGVDGITSASGNAFPTAQLTLESCSAGVDLCVGGAPGRSAPATASVPLNGPSGTVSLSVAATPNTTVDEELILSTTISSVLTPTGFLSAWGSGNIDFSHTVTLKSIELLDANGNVITSGAGIYDLSGVGLPGATPVPEPSTLGILATAGLLLVTFRLKRS